MHHYAEVVLPPVRPSQKEKTIHERVFQTLRWHGFGSRLGFDWFVVGGRWSGCKAMGRLDGVKVGAFWAEFKKRGYEWMDKENSQEKRAQQGHSLFGEFFPDYKGETPVCRDQYRQNGYPDDVCSVSEVPEGLTSYVLVIAQTHEMLETEIWDQKNAEMKKTKFDGRIRAALAERKIVDGVVVTIDYHT